MRVVWLLGLFEMLLLLQQLSRFQFFPIKLPWKPAAPSLCNTFYNPRESRDSPAAMQSRGLAGDRADSDRSEIRPWSQQLLPCAAARPCTVGLHGGSQLGGSNLSLGTAASPRAALSMTDPKSRATDVGESGGEAARGAVGLEVPIRGDRRNRAEDRSAGDL